MVEVFELHWCKEEGIIIWQRRDHVRSGLCDIDRKKRKANAFVKIFERSSHDLLMLLCATVMVEVKSGRAGTDTGVRFGNDKHYKSNSCRTNTRAELLAGPKARFQETGPGTFLNYLCLVMLFLSSLLPSINDVSRSGPFPLQRLKTWPPCNNNQFSWTYMSTHLLKRAVLPFRRWR